MATVIKPENIGREIAARFFECQLPRDTIVEGKQRKAARSFAKHLGRGECVSISRSKRPDGSYYAIIEIIPGR